MDVSPDFYEYFSATFPVLHQDPSLWCVSAWNDNGKVGMVSDEAGNDSLIFPSPPGPNWWKKTLYCRQTILCSPLFKAQHTEAMNYTPVET